MRVEVDFDGGKGGGVVGDLGVEAGGEGGVGEEPSAGCVSVR